MIGSRCLRTIAAALAAAVVLLPGAAAGASGSGPAAGGRLAAAAGGRLAAATASVRAAAAPSGPPGLTTLASGLDNPRHLNFGPDGALYVTEAGHGGTGPCAGSPETGGQQCLGATGAVAKITPGGTLTTVLSGLPSSAGSDGTGAGGPSDAVFDGTNLHVTVQDTNLDQKTGANPFGPGGALLGHLVTAAPGSASSAWTAGPDFAAYEAQHNPDNGAGAAATGQDAIDSDPYAVTPYQGGFAVADAAANDLLFVNPAGSISVLAVFPVRTENIPAGVFGPDPVTAPIQAVPTSVKVGPDGALYVGELAPGLDNTARVWRVVAGQAPTVFADHLTGISDLAFDKQGRLLVLEISVGGLNGLGQAPGALIRIEPNGIHTLLASDGLFAPTGVAVAPDGTIVVSNFGIFPASGPTPPGEVDVVTPPNGPPGYRVAGRDGSVYNFGTDQALGSGTGKLTSPVVGMASTPDHGGYWLATADGSVYSFGDAKFQGGMGGKHLNQPIVGIAATPDGGGYWLVAADGGIFNFGNAGYDGSTGAIKLNKPIVGIAATPDGVGYSLVASDGGIFSFGSAAFWGSTGAMKLNQPIVGMARTADGAGYWLVASDGGVFSFGDGVFLGSTGAMKLNRPIVAIEATRDGSGYRLLASDGGIFSFNAAFAGSPASSAIPAPAVSIAS